MEGIQAIVLCNSIGSNISPVSDNMCKYLLDVGGKPLVSFVLEYLERHNIRDIVILLNEQNEKDMNEYIQSRYKKLNNNTNIVLYTPSNDILHGEDKGKIITLIDVLPHMYNTNIISKDFIVMMGDTITDMNLFKLTEYHYFHQSTMTVVCERYDKPVKNAEVRPKPFQYDIQYERFLYVLDKHTDRLLGYVDPFDMKNGIQMNKSTLCRHPSVSYNNELINRNIMMCNLSVCNIICKLGKNFNDFFEDFISFVSYYQYNKKLYDIISVDDRESSDIDAFYNKMLNTDFNTIKPHIYIDTSYYTYILFYILVESNTSTITIKLL